MELQHVCMWKNNKGWQRITAEEAQQLFPNGASAHSELFMCEICQQLVTFVKGETQKCHFRHLRDEENNCPEKTSLIEYRHEFQDKDYSLPLRLVIKDNHCFALEIGMYLMEPLIASVQRFYIANNQQEKLAEYNKERIVTNRYVEIGSNISEKYKISFSNMTKVITVEGISNKGTIFDVSTGVRLVHGSDVKVVMSIML